MENHKKSYEFFLSELFKGDEPELGYIIELMRAAGHIHEIQKLLFFVSTPDSPDEDETLEYEVELESLRVFLFNVTAAQLREALKLFHKFTKLPFYGELKDDFNEEQKITVSALENYVNEFEHKKGLLYNILKPLRDKVFHYDEKEATEWGKRIIADEKHEKPRVHSISMDKFEFGPGLEYDNDLFSKYLFWGGGEQARDSLMKAQIEIWKIHKYFLDFVKIMSEILMKRAKIHSDRPFGWILKYRYGFKRNE
jgi:hypothetical protein